MTRRFNPEEVKFSVTADYEDLSLEGAFDLGSDELNREVVETITARLERGEVWAWASVRVSASWAGFTGAANLGGCNYTDEADFRKSSGYFKDMVLEAVNELVGEIGKAGWPLECTLEDIKKAVARETA